MFTFLVATCFWYHVSGDGDCVDGLDNTVWSTYFFYNKVSWNVAIPYEAKTDYDFFVTDVMGMVNMTEKKREKKQANK